MVPETVAAAELLVTADGDRFTMPPAARAVLVDEHSLAFAAGAFTGGRPPAFVDQVADAFRTGLGPGYDDRGDQGAHEVERMSAAWSRTALVSAISHSTSALAALSTVASGAGHFATISS